MSCRRRSPQKNEVPGKLLCYEGRMKNLIAVTLVLGAVAGCGRFGGGPKSEDDKTFYALGMIIGKNLTDFNLTPRELDIVKAGLTDTVQNKKPAVALDTY